MNDLVYLFCLTETATPCDIQGRGIDRQSLLETLPLGELTAVVSRVKREDFVGPDAESRMQDLAWVGPRALRHQQVIQDVMGMTQVVPVRFATLFSDPATLGQRIGRHRASLLEFLSHSRNHAEWSVKALFDRKAALEGLVEQALASRREALAALPRGRRYFEEQKIRNGAESELKAQLAGTCRDAETTLAELAADIAALRLQGRDDTGLELDMLANWAFLVEDSSLAAFQSAVRALGERHRTLGIEFRVSGPWPPYSFCPELHGD